MSPRKWIAIAPRKYRLEARLHGRLRAGAGEDWSIAQLYHVWSVIDDLATQYGSLSM